MEFSIYHNPRCTKSRQALALLEKKGKKIQVIEYLNTPPSEKDLKTILKKLNISAFDLVRMKEPLYKEKYKSKKLSESQWIAILAKNPILIERPIIVKGNKAVIGRPTENINLLLK